MPRRGAILRAGTAVTAATSALLVAGCGGGARQDAADHAATYRVDVAPVSFPRSQTLAQHTRLRITVRNADTRTIPNLAATIEAPATGTSAEAFATLSDQPDLASTSRPLWVLDAGPYDGDTAAPNTWAIGSLAPGATKTFTWDLTAITPGTHTITYRLAGSVAGKSKLALASTGEVPQGAVTVRVSDKPAQAKVTPDGRIVRIPG